MITAFVTAVPPCLTAEASNLLEVRYMACTTMQAVEPDISKAFPADGKIVVNFGGRTAEALLELPAPSTRDGAAELPAVVWLTVGLLASDSFALQVDTACCLTARCLFWHCPGECMHACMLSMC